MTPEAEELGAILVGWVACRRFVRLSVQPPPTPFPLCVGKGPSCPVRPMNQPCQELTGQEGPQELKVDPTVPTPPGILAKLATTECSPFS